MKTWTCDKCGATINLGHDDDRVPEWLRAAFSARLIDSHRCSPTVRAEYERQAAARA